MGRKILFVTTDQQRYDSLGCTGGRVARTPVIDQLARDGVLYHRAHPPNVVCMPSRATMLTGQNVRHHGVWMNGVPLPADAPSVAQVLHDAGYATALVGKAHFEPFLDPFLRFEENRLGLDGRHGPHRGFDHLTLATHGGMGATHYAQWLREVHPGASDGYYPVLDLTTLEVNDQAGGGSGAPQVTTNPLPRELYHTDWVADRAIAWLDSLDDAADWFCWVSFPDPHHPWDPPQAEMGRVDPDDLNLPAGFPYGPADLDRVLEGKPRHWRMWWEGSLVSNYEAPAGWVPATLTADQVREVNARVHVENELIDEAVGRILRRVEARGWGADTDVVFTTDHGEFQGDFGLLFKGPYHVDALMRLPLIWRPAPSVWSSSAESVGGAEVLAPVGLVDLAPTFCAIAGVPVPEWMDGIPLPRSETEAWQQRRTRVLTEWDSRHPAGVEVHLQTLYTDGYTCTTYEPGTVHDGSEGELYDHADDPLQKVNRWDDPDYIALRDDLLADLCDHLPPRPAHQLPVQAPV
ncbi:MAG TPA: sulfatase-like hydrolase/transferase [Acidimicrobiales bacterium]|jgi:arylsulfatase A-like enzyme